MEFVAGRGLRIFGESVGCVWRQVQCLKQRLMLRLKRYDLEMHNDDVLVGLNRNRWTECVGLLVSGNVGSSSIFNHSGAAPQLTL